MPLIADKISENSLEIEQAKLDRKKQEQQVSAIKTSVVDPLSEAVEEFSESVFGLSQTFQKIMDLGQNQSPQEYFDKELNPKVIEGIEKIALLIQKIQPQKIDLSPIKEIADSVNSRNADLIKALNALSDLKNDTSGYDNLFKQVMALIQKNNEYLQAGIKMQDYTQVLEKINSTLENNRPVSWEFTSKGKNKFGEITTKATPNYKK